MIAVSVDDGDKVVDLLLSREADVNLKSMLNLCKDLDDLTRLTPHFNFVS